MKSKILLVSLGWIYYILPFTIFCSIIIIPFSFGYILGGNSTTKISDLFSVIVSFLTLWLAYYVAINWRSQLFATKFVEKILQAKEDIRNIDVNASEVIASVQCEILNEVRDDSSGPRLFNSFCKNVNKVLKESKHYSTKDLLNLLSIEESLDLFDSGNADKLKISIKRYREYYYVSCFAMFRLDFDHEFRIKFYLAECIDSLSIESDLKKIGLKYKEKDREFSANCYDLYSLKCFYENFFDQFRVAEKELNDEFNKYISSQTKPSPFR
ncbi:hypothetical protein [Vibrio metschnikovii]|uniref:hypothetical protein n=1 Tax=Vibrio metschnikovii TaxID=28172 RepID=UPI001C30B450|nr:hypothetical protein [Vibrio metschnikovii]